MWKHVTPSLSRLLVLDSKGRTLNCAVRQVGLFTYDIYIRWGREKRAPGIPRAGEREHTLTLHFTQSESRIHIVHSNTVITFTHVQPRRLQGRSIQGRWRQTSEKHSGTPGEHEGLSWATLTLLSTTLQWGTPLQPGLKCGRCSWAVMSHRWVCRTGEGSRRHGGPEKHRIPGQPLAGHDNLTLCQTHTHTRVNLKIIHSIIPDFDQQHRRQLQSSVRAFATVSQHLCQRGNQRPKTVRLTKVT